MNFVLSGNIFQKYKGMLKSILPGQEGIPIFGNLVQIWEVGQAKSFSTPLTVEYENVFHISFYFDSRNSSILATGIFYFIINMQTDFKFS